MYFNKNIYKVFKSFLDFVFGIIFFILGLPLILIIAFLIKLSSSGPIFYLHKRIGKDQKYFYCIKFRTMFPDSQDILENLLLFDENSRNEFKKNHKLKNDPRITPIGKFLRKTSLDELPQIINVIKCEMSIVGPRPIVKDEINKYGESFEKVISIKPGITGLWQVSGRNNLSYKKRISLDLIYLRDYSFIMDLRILFRTIGVILIPHDRGSY